MTAADFEPVLGFEDLTVGMEAISPRRTVTEADISLFAGLSGDYNALHTDEVFAASTPFGERVAHGLLGVAIASGLFTRTRLSQALSDTLVAFTQLEWRFLAPVRVGDTLHVRARIVSLEPTPSNRRGRVTLERDVVNQHGVIVQRGATQLLVRRRSLSPPPSAASTTETP